MHPWKLVAVVVALSVLLYGTVAVFHALDSVSSSASDTLRPFILTMGPVWALAIAGGWTWLRAPQPRPG